MCTQLSRANGEPPCKWWTPPKEKQMGSKTVLPVMYPFIVTIFHGTAQSGVSYRVDATQARAAVDNVIRTRISVSNRNGISEVFVTGLLSRQTNRYTYTPPVDRRLEVRSSLV